MSDTEPSVGIKFLLEEYKNIAATHDKLRDVVARLFNFFLLLSAFPFTVAGIMFSRGEKFDLLAAPAPLHFLFFAVGSGIFFLTLALLDARLRQYWYAKTVNEIRRYFAEHAPEIKNYLYLPTSTAYPHWSALGFVWYQIFFMLLIGSTFVFYALLGIAGLAWGIASMVIYIAAHFIVHFFIQRSFEQYRHSR